MSVNFAKEMKNEKLQGLDTDKLIAFRIFGVDPAFIHELRAAGLPATDCDKFVAFKIHGVTPDMVRFVKQAGYQPERRHAGGYAHPWSHSGVDEADAAGRL